MTPCIYCGHPAHLSRAALLTVWLGEKVQQETA
jgi:hypothetical protein